MVPSLELGASLLPRQLAMAFLRNVLRKNAYSPRVTFHVTITMVSLLARRQVLQRLLGLRVVVACRGLDDALLPSAVVFGGETVPPMADSNACCPGALTVPSLELVAIFVSRQLTIAFLLNVLRKDDDFSSILHTVSVTDMFGTFGLATVFNQDISAWNTALVTSMDLMFYAYATASQMV